MFEIEGIRLRLKLLDPRVPKALKVEPRNLVKAKIDMLKRLASFIYVGERPTAVDEYTALMDRILKVKPKRDALAHGIFHLVDNQNPDLVVVYHKGVKHPFSKAELRNLANEIGEIGGTLKGFDSWVHYESTAAWRDKLQQQNPQ